MSLKERIFSRIRGGEVVHVEEWGESVLVTGLPAIARLEGSRGGQNAAKDPAVMGPLALRYGLRDPETRQPLFTVEEVDALLRDDDQGVTDRLILLIVQKSKFGKAGQDAAVRDFPEAQSADLPSS